MFIALNTTGDPSGGGQTVTFANRGGDRANGFQTMPFTPAAWNHLVCTYNGTDPYDFHSYAVYVNGQSLGLKPTVFLNGAPFGGDTKQNNLGYDSYSFGAGSTPKFFIGSLNELLVYNTVLSAGDVEVLYGGRQRTSDGPYPRAGNLVAGVHLDEGRGTTVADFSGHGNDGTLHGGATWGPGRGVVQHARAMQFDGTRYATLPQSTKFTSSDFTVSLWFKPTKDHESQFLFMRGFADRDQPGDIGLKINPDGGGLDFAVRTADSQWLFGWPKSSLRGVFKVNQWNHVVVSRRGGARPMATLDTCTMWINGVRVGTEVAMNTDIGDTPNTNPFIVGGMMTDNGVHDMFQGALDEFRIFHRCLSDAEIATLYRGGDVLDSGDSRRSGDSGQNVADSLFSK